MNIVEQAFNELYPNETLYRKSSIRYSGKFKKFNANVRYTPNTIHFNLSKEWRSVSREIQIGLIQNFLVKIYKGKPNTGYRDMYESFIKNLSKYSPATESDPILEISFNRANEKYFNSNLEKPNLKWGAVSTSRLGSYEYHTNTITISSILRKASPDLLDYIMHHEMLHKKLKFYSKSGRSFHHTSEFKESEKKFENREKLEKELRALCAKSRIKGLLFGNWFR